MGRSNLAGKTTTWKTPMRRELKILMPGCMSRGHVSGAFLYVLRTFLFLSTPFFLPRSLALNGGPQKTHKESHPTGEKSECCLSCPGIFLKDDGEDTI